MAAFTIQVQFDAATMAAFTGAATALASIAATLKSEQPTLTAMAASLAEISAAITAPPPPVPVKIRLALPTLTKNGVIMANFELANDEVATIPILVDDAGGTPVPPPSGDTFSVTSSSASLGASIGADGKSVVLTPMVQQSPGLTVVVSDSAGLSSFTQIVDIVQDTTPKAITLDIASATETPQPIPTAPGP